MYAGIDARSYSISLDMSEMMIEVYLEDERRRPPVSTGLSAPGQDERR